MPRTKNYNEQEVLEKAMNLFWENGYDQTSMQHLEKAMGINKFSIYASFGSKSKLLQESIKCYGKKLNVLVDKLRNTPGGAVPIKQYFYDFITFSKENGIQKGCLITNTANECVEGEASDLQELLNAYSVNIRHVFAEKLNETNTYNNEEIQQKADYLFIAMFGFSSATRLFTQKQLDNYINQIFIKL